jgi:hypothetical protein
MLPSGCTYVAAVPLLLFPLPGMAVTVTVTVEGTQTEADAEAEAVTQRAAMSLAATAPMRADAMVKKRILMIC